MKVNSGTTVDNHENKKIPLSAHPLHPALPSSPKRLHSLPTYFTRRTDGRDFFLKAVDGGETQRRFIQAEKDGHEAIRKIDGETPEHSPSFDLNSAGTIRYLTIGRENLDVLIRSGIMCT